MLINHWKFSTKIVIAFSALISLGLGSLALMQYRQLRTSQRQAMADRLSEIVQLAVPQIDGDYHSLVVAAQDANTTYYRINQGQLAKIREASDDIQHLYTIRQQSDGGYAYVLDYRPEKDVAVAAVGDRLLNLPPMLDSSQSINESTVEFSITRNQENIPVLIGYSPIFGQFDRVDGLLVVELDARPVLRREVQAQRIALASLAAILLITVVTVRYLAKLLVVRPTLMLNEAAKRLAQGEWTAILPVTRKDELGELAQSFNHMAQRLRESFKQLEDYSQNLEAKVESRTQELSASQRLLNLVMNNIPQSIFWKDRKSTYLGCNQSFADTVGVSVEEIVGRQDSELPWMNSNVCLFAKSDRSVIDSGEAKLGVVESQQQVDGHQTWLEMSKVPLYDDKEQVMGLIGIFQDITPYKEAERAAHQASEAKSEFLANMNHELRTPLNGILGYTQILQRDSEIGDKHRQRLDTIHHCASHLLLLINDILDFSKLEVKKTALYPQDFHLIDFLDTTINMCRIKAEQKNVQVICELSTDLPTVVHADDKRLRQVLLNLLGNATKFTDGGKVIFRATVVSSRITSNSTESFWRLRFEIEDTGIGIAPDKLQKIFSPFEQAGERDRNAQGTGLGLAISQQIVQKMGGEIEVESALGVGSLFWFEVDLALAKEWSSDGSGLEDSVSICLDSSQSISLAAESNACPADNPSDLWVVPPATELDALYAAASDGFMGDVQQEAQRLAALDDRFVPFSERVLELCRQFDDKAILDIVRPIMQETVVS